VGRTHRYDDRRRRGLVANDFLRNPFHDLDLTGDLLSRDPLHGHGRTLVKFRRWRGFGFNNSTLLRGRLHILLFLFRFGYRLGSHRLRCVLRKAAIVVDESGAKSGS
jgi:hypothetical protein